MKAKNVDEFEQTIERYKEILKMDFTDEEFVPFDYDEGANKTTGTIHVLMGFGRVDTCRLCKLCTIENVDEFMLFCGWCVYQMVTGARCSRGKNKLSYCKIRDAQTWEELKEAVSLRIEHMEDVLRKLTNGQSPQN